VFVFCGRRGDRIKVLCFDGDGMCLSCKRLEAGRFVWPQAQNGRVALTSAQLPMLLEGIDWCGPRRTAPTLAARVHTAKERTRTGPARRNPRPA